MSRGVRYLDNLDLTLEADLGRAVGLADTTLFLYGLYNNGTAFSDGLVGDAQVVSNIEAPVAAFRLYEAWLEHRLFEDAVSLRAGLYDVNAEFDALESAGLFLNSAHGIGTDIGQTGE
ncbi:MAG: carbohydrate porin, partial [Sphingomonadales bacterium]|nr:carbohydrate porin [Sphingomonadales bacterium]